MIQLETWPPPAEWEEVVVTWKVMLSSDWHNPPAILEWIETAPGGRYHLHGWRSTEGFAFRFERPEDATYFRLIWS